MAARGEGKDVGVARVLQGQHVGPLGDSPILPLDYGSTCPH